MNIVHVVGYYPPHTGGMELRTKNLADNTAKKGHSVTVLTSDVGTKVGKLKSSKNLTIRYLKTLHIAHTPIMFSLPFRLLFIPKNSVIHLHISQAFLAEVTYLICKIRGIAYLTHIHLDVDKSGAFGFLLPLYKKYISSTIIRQSDAVTVLTKDYKKLMIERYKVDPNKIKIIPNGTYFSTGNQKRKKIHKPLRILFVGRLSNQKNIPLLLKSISLLIKKYKISLVLTIIGDGEKKKETIRLINKLNIGKFVHILGEKSPSEVQKYYRTHDIFILSSERESFGSVIIESIASGTPVVAVRIPSVRNIIKNEYNGILVKSTPESLAKGVKKLADDHTLYKNLITNGLEDVKKYNWNTVTQMYEDLYSNLLLSKRK